MTHTQHFVTFYSPGTFFAETTGKPIDSWDTRAAIGLAEGIRERYNARPYGFRFETRIVADPVPDGHGGTLHVESKTTRESGMHFIGGMLETYDDVRLRGLATESIMLSNMRGNEWWIVCTTVNGYTSTQPFGEEDVVVDAAGNITERGDSPERMAYRARCTAERDAEYEADAKRRREGR